MQQTLGKRINQLRKSKGLTSEQLSELCGVNAVHIRRIESGGSLLNTTPATPIRLVTNHMIPLVRRLYAKRKFFPSKTIATVPLSTFLSRPLIALVFPVKIVPTA